AELGIESIMVNCNPETVSTDYDTSDRLYFEPLTAEDVLEIIRTEQSNGTLAGVIVQYGGQTPLKLASTLDKEGVPILGTPFDAIDLAEDRERFQKLVVKLGLKQPANATAASREDAIAVAADAGYPLVTRPSYVLGGRAMEIVRDEAGLRHYLATAQIEISDDEPLLLDHYLDNATEVDVDAICDGETVFIAGVMEHIEEAGIHSGDSACSLPPYTLPEATVAMLEEQTKRLALALGVVGLVNVQYAIKGDDIYILEVNPRASRTAPFVAKATGLPIAKIAAKVMAGEKVETVEDGALVEHAVKSSVHPN
ncbi:MAG TPA: ATP-grasp domain-containing protein, partial [Parvularculaceae bacterium]|nr:ATP-grasp domain-containing protein [Parvularculaceae bacterium]